MAAVQTTSVAAGASVSVADAPNLHLTNQFTLDAWVDPADLSDSPMVVSRFGGSNDSYELHLRDTERAGRGLVRRSAAEILVHEAPTCVRDLQSLGVRFDGSELELSAA